MLEQQITTARNSSISDDISPRLHINTPPSPQCEVCVVIPVRDESQTLEVTLSALASQTDVCGWPLNPATYETIVLANNCRDDSATIARRFAARHPEIVLHVAETSLPAADAHVGMARRLLMDEAYRRLTWLGKPRGIIVTTDADTSVSPTWVAATTSEVRLGADAVGGRIVVHPADLRSLSATGRECHLRNVGYRSLAAELESRLDPNMHDPWPRHFQHFGASLAVTAETYLRAGRLPAQPWLEDVAFFNALMRIDARLRHSPSVRVTTSGRNSGRTGFGFAVQLSRWERLDLCNQPMWVESAQAIEARILGQQRLRHLWHATRAGLPADGGPQSSLAFDLGIDPGVLRNAPDTSASFGTLLEEVHRAQHEAGIWRERWPLVDIRDAIHDLRVRLDTLRRQSAPLHRFLEEIQPVEAGAVSAQVS